MMDRGIVKKPLVSEKSYNMAARQQYSFEVDKKANKTQVAKAIQNIFNVHVESVNTLIVKPKPKRVGRFQGKTKKWKKAIVTLREGDRIEIFEGI